MFASFFKFLCICATESLPGIYKPPELSQIIQSLTCLHLAALPWRGPDHCSRTCSLTHRQCHRNILVAIVIYIATFWLPLSSTSQHFGCQSHLTTQDVLSKCTPKNVLAKCTVKLVLQASSLLTSFHSGQACHCGAVSWLWRSFPAHVSLKLLPGATHPATAGRPLWAGFARDAVSHSRPAERCHTRNSTSFLSVVQGLTLDTATRCHTGSHSNSFLSCLWRKCPAQLSSSLPSGATIYCVWLCFCHHHKVPQFSDTFTKRK